MIIIDYINNPKEKAPRQLTYSRNNLVELWYDLQKILDKWAYNIFITQE